MRKRLKELVHLLLGEKSWIASRDLEDRLHVSRRALSALLDELDGILTSNGLSPIQRVPSKGVGLLEGERGRVALLVEGGGGGSLIDLTDPASRRFFLLFSITSVDSRCTVDRLAEQTATSSRTVSNDMRALRKTLEMQSLRLTFDKRDGYQVHGDVFTIRNLLLVELRSVFAPRTCADVVRTMRDLFRLAGQSFEMFDIPQLAELARTLDDVLPNYYEKNVRWTLLLQLVLLAVERPGRRSYGLTIADRSYLQRSASFELARFLRVRASKLLGRGLSDEEDFYLGMLLQFLPTTTRSNDEQNYPFELEVVAQKIILSVSEGYEYEFQDDPELFGIIVSHLIPLVYRLQFRAQIENPLLDGIVTKYAKLHGAVTRAMTELERYVGAAVSDDECAFVTLYFASSIEKLANARRGVARVVVVCNAGNAASRLLQYKLMNAFSVEVAAAVSLAELPGTLAGESSVDLVVGVVDVPSDVLGGTPFLRVTPFVTQSDYQNLSAYLSRRVFAAIDAGERPGKGLLELLDSRCFEVCDSVGDMDDLIARGGGLLHRFGYCDGEYPQQMISAAHCFGPLTTILIAPGIIMPHAGISEHVWRTGFSFVRVRKPVIVNGKEVTCALSLCSRDKRVNQRAIQQVGLLLSRSQFMERVNEVSSYEEFARLVKSCLNKAER